MRGTSKSQYSLRTIFLYTFVVALGLAYCGSVKEWQIAICFAGPMLAWVPLFERAIDCRLPLKQNVLGIIFQVFAVSVFSCATLMLSTLAFAPEWKGSKGMNWLFYVNDGLPAAIMYPFYFGGAVAFAYVVQRGKDAKCSPLVLAAIIGNALISFLYVFYVLVMRYIPQSGARLLFVVVPGAAAISYSLMAIALVRRFRSPDEPGPWIRMYVWAGSFFVGCLAKVPFAMLEYQRLPNDPPRDCFVVTAATRGHRCLVGTSHDARLDREVNNQLLRFWRFEVLLADKVPGFHRGLRLVYNQVGPFIAKRILWRWQADIVYLGLKPLEWVSVLIVHMTKPN